MSTTNIIGRKIEGFRFESMGDILWHEAMEDYIGRIGKILFQHDAVNTVLVSFPDGISCRYPLSLIEQHLVPEEKINNNMKIKVTPLGSVGSSPAPKEWREIPEIKECKPGWVGKEVSLQKIDGTKICVWMVGQGGIWKAASEYFMVSGKNKNIQSNEQ